MEKYEDNTEKKTSIFSRTEDLSKFFDRNMTSQYHKNVENKQRKRKII